MVVAPVKVCNFTFTNIRLRHGCICHCCNFLTVHKNTDKKICAKYLSADGCFIKTNTINCDDNDNTMFPITRVFAFTWQPMKQNFT